MRLVDDDGNDDEDDDVPDAGGTSGCMPTSSAERRGVRRRVLEGECVERSGKKCAIVTTEIEKYIIASSPDVTGTP